eukprot:CAMPEP_0118905160 /NCGR_PEP_ID=MMETSP1166-20130328/9307_1 /TAXON_ID=1104430 /ORGANISM="Chrysoreinhardia sp, Strain CCMP3193" /LENGTH=773 /DNA_ID=CAMNT_0006844429 /DNA_START=1 /DNA_END=2319 /DNA_ORIENTATION=+
MIDAEFEEALERARGPLRSPVQVGLDPRERCLSQLQEAVAALETLNLTVDPALADRVAALVRPTLAAAGTTEEDTWDDDDDAGYSLAFVARSEIERRNGGSTPRGRRKPGPPPARDDDDARIGRARRRILQRAPAAFRRCVARHAEDPSQPTGLASFSLRVYYDPLRTGFEDSKDLRVTRGAVLGGRYEIKSVVGRAAFSTAYAAVDRGYGSSDSEGGGGKVGGGGDIGGGVGGGGVVVVSDSEERKKKEKNHRQHRQGPDADSEAEAVGDEVFFPSSGKKEEASPPGGGGFAFGGGPPDPPGPPGPPAAPPAASRRVCLKVIQNNKDFFDQSIDEIKLLRYLNESCEDVDERRVVRLVDYFYAREHLVIVTELLGENLYEHARRLAKEETFFFSSEGEGSSFSRAGNNDDSSPASPESLAPPLGRRGGSGDGQNPYGSSFSSSGGGWSSSSSKRGCAFSAAAVRDIARDCVIALEYVHSLGLVHCDVKPENVVLRPEPSEARGYVVKLIDFGSSCFVSDPPATYVQSRSYRAPEVLLGAPYAPNIDLWSLGCVLAEVHTGDVLFHNDSVATLLARLVAVLGPIPPRLLAEGRFKDDFFLRATGEIYDKVDPKRTTALRKNNSTDDHSGGRDGRSVGGLGGSFPAAEEKSSIGNNNHNPGMSSSEDDVIPPGVGDGISDDEKDSEAESATQDTFVLVIPKPTTLAHRLHLPQDSPFVDFLHGLLTIDPLHRPSARLALRHKYLLEEHYPPPRAVPGGGGGARASTQQTTSLLT